jgi:hypothetical protein
LVSDPKYIQNTTWRYKAIKKVKRFKLFPKEYIQVGHVAHTCWLIPAFRRLRQEDCKFKTSLGYIGLP